MLTGKDGSILEYRTMQYALERGPGSGPSIQPCYSLYHLFIVIIHSASLVGTKQFRHHITCTSRVLRSEGDKDTDKSQSLVSRKSRKKVGGSGDREPEEPQQKLGHEDHWSQSSPALEEGSKGCECTSPSSDF